MRSSLKTCIAVAAALLVVPSFASADDVGGGDDLQELLSRMSDLEQQLQATNDALAASSAKVNQQQKMLGKLGTSKQSGAMLALSDFLTETTFGGWVSGSYFYNTNNPNSGQTTGANAGTFGANRFHPNSNAFQVDQVWFSMSNQATPESRGGFEIDIVYGQTGDRLDFSSGSIDTNVISDYLYNANISYLAPITDAGIEITVGRFEDHIGSEAVQDPYNFNITRGLLWGLQPVGFTGVKASSEYDSGLSWMLGISNNSGYSRNSVVTPVVTQAQNFDADDSKVFLWSVGYQASDTLSVSFNGLYGGDCARVGANPAGNCGLPGRNSDRQVLYDFTLNWDPSDRLSTWLNIDYMYPTNDARAGSPYILGIAAAGRYGITDDTGIAMRFEYIYSNDNYVGVVAPAPSTFFPDDQDIFSTTATLDHALTEHLSVKAEVVYQVGHARDTRDSVFFCNSGCGIGSTSKDQLLLGAQMTYEF
jgi:hypothetical protein